MSTLLHATVYVFLINLLNVLLQIANKMGLQKNHAAIRRCITCAIKNVAKRNNKHKFIAEEHKQQQVLLPTLHTEVTELRAGTKYLCKQQTLTDSCGGGLEYLHRSPASRKRRQKGTQWPGV
jgi:hypothetical protein